MFDSILSATLPKQLVFGKMSEETLPKTEVTKANFGVIRAPNFLDLRQTHQQQD